MPCILAQSKKLKRAVLNGWKVAPHCWKTYLLRPVIINRAPGQWVSVSVFGFVVFFEEQRP